MTWTRKRVAWAIVLVWIAGNVALAVAFGKSPKPMFNIQDEYKLPHWAKLGPLTIDRGFVYLALSTIATFVTVWYVAKKMRQRPNRVQTAVETMFSLMRDNITHGNMDEAMAARWFPFIGTLFLFIWFNNMIGYIPLPTNTDATINVLGINFPSFALYAATANVSVAGILSIVVFIVFNLEGFRKWGFRGYFKHLMPGGVGKKMLILIAPLEIISNFMRLVSLTIRLWANILAGHMIILFMAGGLAVLQGLSLLGWFTMPAGVLVYIFEVGLIATLQAFIFATLAAIYLGGAVEGH
jgi:F-type H+-transporting ATPase subunit a